jgi:hypothetical protein
MIRNVLSLLVVAGLAYGAYLVNEKFFAAPPKPPQPAAIAVNDPTLTPFICPIDVEAFDPASPDKTLGYFTKGTEIKVGADSGTPGLKNVLYEQPDGRVVQALCKADDLKPPKDPFAIVPLQKRRETTEQTASSSVAPLEKSKLSIVEQPKTTTCFSGLQTGTCGGGGDVVRMGQTKAVTIEGTFGGQTLPPTPKSAAPTAAQGVKERAKDLQNPNSQTQPSP